MIIRKTTLSWATGLVAATTLASMPVMAAANQEPPPKSDETTTLPPDKPGSVGYDDVGDSPAQEMAARIDVLAQYKDNGYSSTVIHPKEDLVDLWWHGSLDPEVKKVVDDINKEGKVTVRIHEAKRSQAQMNRLQIKIFEGRAKLESKGIKIHGIDSPVDQSGFNIRITPAEGNPSKQARAERSNTAKKDAEEVAGIPILSVEEQPMPTPLRQADFPPWFGGAMIINSQGESCSTGFAVEEDEGGRGFMLSAAHCNVPYTNRRTWYNGERDRVDGNPTGRLFAGYANTYHNVALDSLILAAEDGTSGRMYWGGYADDDWVGVRDYLTVDVGSNVRSNGANSGSHDVLKVISLGYGWYCQLEPLKWCTGAARVGPDTDVDPNSEGKVQAIRGDSGGPVYSQVAGADPRVWARGIISTGTIQANEDCPPARFPPSPEPACFSEFAMFPMYALLGNWNVHMKTWAWTP